MTDENLPQDIRQKLAQDSIFLTLVNCQLDEIDAQKALQSASIQYMHWEKMSPEERRRQIME